MRGDRRDRERGAGLLSMAVGLTMTLVLMLFATHVLLALYTRSVVGAAAEEGARSVAQGTSDPAQAAARVLSLLGRVPARLDWRIDDDEVVLRVTARAPDVLRTVPVLEALRTVERTARARRELWR